MITSIRKSIILIQIILFYCIFIHNLQYTIGINLQNSKNLRRESSRHLAKETQHVLQPISNSNLVVQQAPGVSKNNNSVGANGTRTTTTCSSADVTLLTDTAFDGDFKTGLRKDVVVYFYKPNPNCPACKKFKPKYDCVATEYKVASDDLLIAKIPISEYPYTQSMYDVDSYPTIRFFPKGYKHSTKFLGKEFTGPFEKDNVVAFIRSVMRKKEEQILADLPAAVNIQVGTKPDVEDVVVDGKRKTLGSPLTTTTNVEDLLYVQIEDDTIDATKLCDGDGIGSGKCLKAVSMSEKICKVTVARPIGKLDREKGGHRIWYTCLKVGECHLTGEVRAAPEPVIFHWKHACGGLARKGFKIGTVAGIGDVVKDGVIDKDWKVPSDITKTAPFASVEAKEAMTTFSMVDTENTAGFDIRPVRVHVSNPSVLKVDVSGDVSTEAESLDKDVYINYPGMINAALKKPTKLSSVWDDHFSSKAVDGSHGTAEESHMACAISGMHGQDPQPYLEVDLGEDVMKDSIVKHIRVWNTPSVDTQYRLVPMRILVSAEPLPRDLEKAIETSLYTKRFTDIKEVYNYILPANNAFARYVRVQLENTDYLQVAELEVFVVPESIRCNDPIADNRFAICAKGGVNQPVSSVLKYTCNKPGNAIVQMEVPLFPQYHPNSPLNYAYKKSCTQSIATDVMIGKSERGSEIVDSGVISPGFRFKKTFANAIKSFNRTIIEGSERVLAHYLQMMTKGSSQGVLWPTFQVKQEDEKKPTLQTMLVPWQLSEKQLNIRDIPTAFNISFGCIKKGRGMVNIFLTFAPIYQPFKPIKYSIVKECGGRPVGLNVYRGKRKEIVDLDSGSSAKKVVSIFPENEEDEKLNLAIEDGIFLPQFANTDPKIGTGIVPEDERVSTFYLDVPPTEIEHGYGNRTAPPTPCRGTYISGKCRQLQRSHDPSNSNPVRAKCEPNICSSDFFGFTSGPAISGEAVGSGESSKSELASASGKVPMHVHYGCTRKAQVVVSITYKPEFYDEVTMQYVKQCLPWSHTFWGAITVWSVTVVGTVTLIGGILFIGGENSLYHRMSHGPSVSFK